MPLLQVLPPHPPYSEVGAVKFLKELGELLNLLGENPEFLYTHAEAIERVVKQAAADIRYMKHAWQALSEEEKLQEIAAKAPWKRSRSGRGEYVAADLVPSLIRAVKAKQGRLYAGEYVYLLSKSGKWLQRFPRKGGRK